MKTKSLFFIFSAAIIFSPTPYIHGMLAKRAQIASPHGLFSRHMFQARAYTNQNFRIVHYNSEQHEKDITPIVFQNVHRLMSHVTDENRPESTKGAMSTINSSTSEVIEKNVHNITHMKSYVCLAPETDKPIGVVNYCFRNPPYKQITDIFNLDIPQNAVIQMLAIDEKYQGKKAGSALLQHALNDCEHHRVYKVTLGTTSLTLDTFYKRHGFTCTWDGAAIRSPGSEYTKWFQPHHPIVAAILAAWVNSQHKK